MKKEKILESTKNILQHTNGIIELKDIISGRIASTIKFNSNLPGNTTTIIVGVHGNELSGINALNDILKDTIEVISGKVYFIFANLKAIENGTRFFEKNLNRCFLKNNNGNTYEDQRAREIMPYLEESDYLLDIHNTLNTGNSIPFLISEHKELGKYFDVDLIISGFDELHPGGSDGFANSIGKIGLCLESGNIYDKKGPEIAKNGILNFLKFTGNIDGIAISKENQEFIKFNTIYKNETLNFSFTKKFLDFEKVKKGQIIAYDGAKEIVSDRNGYMLFTHIPKNTGDECFCIGHNL